MGPFASPVGARLGSKVQPCQAPSVGLVMAETRFFCPAGPSSIKPDRPAPCIAPRAPSGPARFGPRALTGPPVAVASLYPARAPRLVQAGPPDRCRVESARSPSSFDRSASSPSGPCAPRRSRAAWPPAPTVDLVPGCCAEAPGCPPLSGFLPWPPPASRKVRKAETSARATAGSEPPNCQTGFRSRTEVPPSIPLASPA